MNDSVSDPAAVPTGRGQIVKRVLAVAAIIIQVVLLFNFFTMGLGWGGFGYVANLAQGVILLVVAGLLIPKRPLLVLPVPLLSVLLMLALQAVDPSLKTTACTPPELAAAAEFPPPPGSPPPTFESYPSDGCAATFNSSLSGQQILDHYWQAAEKAEWQVKQPDTGAQTLHLSNESVTAEVTWEPVEEGPLRGQTYVVVHIYERRR